MRSVGDVGAVDKHMPAVDRSQARQCFDQLRLTVTLHAGHADDLAAAHLERNAIDGHSLVVAAHAEVFDIQDDVVGRAGFLGDGENDVAPHHHRSQRALVALAGGGAAYHAPPRSTAIWSEISSTSRSYVRDEDHGFTLGHE